MIGMDPNRKRVTVFVILLSRGNFNQRESSMKILTPPIDTNGKCKSFNVVVIRQMALFKAHFKLERLQRNNCSGHDFGGISVDSTARVCL